MNDDYTTSQKYSEWRLHVCPLCNRMQKLQLKAFTKPYCYLIARTMDDGGFFTSTTSHPRHTCIYADLQQVLLCGAMRLRLNLSQPRQNILIPSSADEDGHGLGLGRYILHAMDEWLSRCIPISFTLWYYFCTLPKESLELRWTSESQNLHYYMSWPILASKIEEMSNIGRLIVETRPGLGTYWCWYHLSGTHDGK